MSWPVGRSNPIHPHASIYPNAPEEVVAHQEERGDEHEGVAHPQRVREAPQALPHHLRVPVESSVCHQQHLWSDSSLCQYLTDPVVDLATD